MNKESPLTFQDRYKRLFIVLNWSVPILLGIYIFCRPFPHTTAITNSSFYLAMIIALVLIFFKQVNCIFKTPLTYPLMIFLLWSALSILWSLNRGNSINDVRGHLLNHIVLYFLLVNFFHTKKMFNSLAWIVVASATFFSIAGMLYYYVILDSPVTTRLGFLVNQSINVSTELPVNMIGTLTISAIIFCQYFFVREHRFYMRIVIASCGFLTFMAIFLTQSRGTLVSLIITATILLFIKNKKIVPFFLIAMVIVIISSPLKSNLNVSSLLERFKINYVTMEVLKDYPILGIGFGMQTFRDNIDKEAYINKIPAKYRPVNIDSPHNLLLDITLRLGLVGLVLFLTIIFVFGKICWEIISNTKDKDISNRAFYVTCAFIAYFIMGIFEPVFLFKASAIIFYIFLAMITTLWRLNQSAREICS
jgi:O-antigen ligase